MNVTLLSCTENGDELAAKAASTCYDSKPSMLVLKKTIESGHESVIEHVSFTFQIEGVSRALLAQITRHRIASFSVQSQRYVSLAEGFGYVIPPRIEALGEEAVKEFEGQMAIMHRWYQQWQERLGEGANEDARFVLPNACETHITFTMNARELRHFFYLRCCNRAQWEIRELADKMLALCKEKCPVIFENAGPGCVNSGCKESRPCGNPRTDDSLFK